MKRVLGLVLVFGAASFAATDAKPQPSAIAVAGTKKAPVQRLNVADLAPADEYFGPLKQSVIGMRNTIRDLGLRYDVNHDIGAQTVASALLTEGAIKDWQHRYPKDDQLPRTLYFLQRLYTKILTVQGRAKAQSIAQWIFISYASSPQAKQLHKIVASEHLPPLPSPSPEPTLNDATTPPDMLAPSPAPSFVPGASATTSPGPGFVTPAPIPVSSGAPGSSAPASGSAAPAMPGVAPMPSATDVTPSPSASPSPSPTPGKSRSKSRSRAEASPSPSASATASATPAPSPSDSPLPASSASAIPSATPSATATPIPTATPKH